MLEELPKLLVNTLEQLIQEKKLCQWNLQDNGNFVYINMRFGSHMAAAQNDNGDSHSFGFRRKSPSERNRDLSRLMSWREKHQSKQSFHNTFTDNSESYTREYRSPGMQDHKMDHEPIINPCHKQSSETGDPFDQADPHGNDNKQCVSISSKKERSDTVFPDAAETFLKVVHYKESQTLHGLTHDRKIATYDCLSPPETQISSGEFAVVDRRHEYYDSLYTVICESEDIMNNDNYTEKLNSMCHLTLTYNSQSSSAIT